ncbi:MAG: superoxide dismutase [Prevotella sp.]|nr:superoxide dismutase [Prevotella sp.]
MENATQNWEQMTYPFFNLKLTYNLDALEPHIDGKTMRAHYDRLLTNYIKNLNEILETRLDLQSMTLTELLTYAAANQDVDLLHQAGGVFNHFFFFTELRPATGQIVIGITPQATQNITTSFGGWKNFKEQFADAALSVFGSGYAWLIKNAAGGLEITTTANQDVPQNGTPILCLDIWEHAYYLQHLNERQSYIDAFWNVVDWVKFSEKI